MRQLIAAFLLLIPALLTAQDTVTVARVIDGTGFRTEDGRTIRLLGLSLPPLKAVTADECRQHLADLLAVGSRVLLRRDSSIADPPRVQLRYVEAVGESVNRRMLGDGYATVASRPGHAQSAEFARAEESARRERLGAWSSERSTAVQCSGTTQKGTRCSRTTRNLSGRCWQHE